MFIQIVSLLAFAASSLAAPVQEVSSLGYLRCSSEGQITGYISKSQNSFGEFKGVSPDTDTSDVNHRMLVSMDLSSTDPQSLLVKVLTCFLFPSFPHVPRQNAPNNDYPFLGAIGGEDGINIGTDGECVPPPIC